MPTTIPLSADQLSTLEQLVPFTLLLIPLAIADLALKGWGMWRAAKMNKTIWFIALLIVNSMGVLPIIFLLMTKKEYRNFRS